MHNAGAIFVGPFAPVSLGDYCAGSNHVLPTAGCACHSSGLSVRAFLKAVHVVDYSRDALAEVADHVVTLAEAEDLPGHGAAVSRPVRPDDATARCARSCAGIEPYGAPQLDVPGPAQRQREPLPALGRRGRRHRARRRRGARSLNRYPDREFTELREASRPTSGHGVTPDQVWAANGSNEVMLQLLQAFGGPGRLALSFAPTYSMYPEYARDTLTAWVAGHREEDFSLDLDRALARWSARSDPRRAAAVAEQPHRHRAAADGGHRCCARRCDDGAASWWSTRRTPSSAGAGTPSALELLAEHRNLVVTRTMSKAFALAGARRRLPRRRPEVCDALRVVRLPYHLSAVTQAAALAALRHADELLGRVDELRAERDATRGLAARRRARRSPTPTRTSCCSARSTTGTRSGRVCSTAGVLIRETGPDGWLRVSIGTPEEMAAFRDALDAR